MPSSVAIGSHGIYPSAKRSARAERWKWNRHRRAKISKTAEAAPPPPLSPVVIVILDDDEEDRVVLIEEPPPAVVAIEESTTDDDESRRCCAAESDLWTTGWRWSTPDAAWRYVFDDGSGTAPVPPGVLTPFTTGARRYLDIWRRLCQVAAIATTAERVQRLRDFIIVE